MVAIDKAVKLAADSLRKWSVVSGINFQNYEAEMALQVVRTLERAGALVLDEPPERGYGALPPLGIDPDTGLDLGQEGVRSDGDG